MYPILAIGVLGASELFYSVQGDRKALVKLLAPKGPQLRKNERQKTYLVGASVLGDAITHAEPEGAVHGTVEPVGGQQRPGESTGAVERHGHGPGGTVERPTRVSDGPQRLQLERPTNGRARTLALQ